MSPDFKWLFGLATSFFLLCSVSASPFSEAGALAPSNDRVIALFEESLEADGIAIGTEVDELSQIVRWAAKNDRISQCIDWLEYKITHSPRSLYLRMALGDSLALSERWNQLVENLEPQQWLYQEHIRLAYLSIAYRSLGNEKWEDSWSEAVEHASVNFEKFHSLVTLTSTWKGWGPQIEQALWMQMEQSMPSESWSAGLLNQVYSAKDNLEGLRKLNRFLLGRNPQNGSLLNNYIAMSVLDNDVASIDADILNRFIEALDSDIRYQLTYALYLKESGNTKDSRAVFDALPAFVSEDPDNALYSAYLYSDDEISVVERYLELARKGDYQSFEKAYFSSRGITVE